jgi:hypothetical protein
MPRTYWTVVISAALVAAPAVAWSGTPTVVSTTCPATCGEGRYCFDAAEPWVHGYYQETPAYGGYHAFRPYNYKHVFAQSQIATEWGMSPTAPYSHQSSRGTGTSH